MMQHQKINPPGYHHNGFVVTIYTHIYISIYQIFTALCDVKINIEKTLTF